MTSLGNGYNSLTSLSSGRVVDLTAPCEQSNGCQIQQWDWLGRDNQQWALVPVDQMPGELPFIPDPNPGTGWTCASDSPPSCDTWCGTVCMDTAVCECGEVPSCQENSGGFFPACNNSCTPLVIDAFDNGFHFTDISHGVRFRVTPNGPLVQMSWPDYRARNGWLALDRNGNGVIDDFTELFGNMTHQPLSTDPNGYLALAVFDDPRNGGNGNGYIDPGDSVYERLTVWVDDNHNGFSEPNQLHSLKELGISRIDLRFQRSDYADGYGNTFRYRSRLWDASDKSRGSSYDVFLTIQAVTQTGKATAGK
ncbi:MAG: RICIN domain-containing protein [Acidobacteriaceae bacterium]|nr:RICIN domain-containing protein [Acidobacteriaceae bacterium]